MYGVSERPGNQNYLVSVWPSTDHFKLVCKTHESTAKNTIVLLLEIRLRLSFLLTLSIPKCLLCLSKDKRDMHCTRRARLCSSMRNNHVS